MDFFKTVLLIAIAYVILGFLWIKYAEECLCWPLLALQSITFGVIVSGLLYFLRKEKPNELSEKK